MDPSLHEKSQECNAMGKRLFYLFRLFVIILLNLYCETLLVEGVTDCF